MKPTTSESLTELAEKLEEKVQSCSNRILNSINLLNKYDV